MRVRAKVRAGVGSSPAMVAGRLKAGAGAAVGAAAAAMAAAGVIAAAAGGGGTALSCARISARVGAAHLVCA